MEFIACTIEAHADAILDIFNEAILTSTALYDYHPRPRESMKAWFKAKQAGGFPVIGAVDAQGTLLGFAGYGTFRAWPAYKYSVEHSVYVHKDHRGKGLVLALMERLIAAARQPGICTLHDPAMTAQPVIAFDASAGDTALDALLPAMLPAATQSRSPRRHATCRVGCAVGRACPRHGCGIHESLEHHRVMPVGAHGAEHQRDALSIRYEAALVAELASVGRAGPRVLAPRELDTLARPG